MGKSILIVEDDADEVFLMEQALAMSSIPAESVILNNGEQAIDYLFSDTDRKRLPDLILLDLKLPGINGFEVLKKIKSSHTIRFIPVVMLSSSELLQDRIEAFNTGASSFIRKPIGFSDLVTQMELVLRYWLTLNQPPNSQ